MDERGRPEQIVQFLATIDQFKTVARAALLSDGSRHESDAEHVWHMCMYALLIAPETTLHMDVARAIELILVHDLVEIYAGDTYAYDTEGKQSKRQRETAAADALFGLLPAAPGMQLRGWWDEFEAGNTTEAKFARAIDKLQAFAQNVTSGGVVWRERGVTEAMSRVYNCEAMALDAGIARVFELLYADAKGRNLWGNSVPSALTIHTSDSHK